MTARTAVLAPGTLEALLRTVPRADAAMFAGASGTLELREDPQMPESMAVMLDRDGKVVGVLNLAKGSR